MNKKTFAPKWYYPKEGLILLAVLIFFLIISIIFVIIDLQFLIIFFVIADLIYLLVGLIHILINKNTLLNQITSRRLWLPIFVIVFASLGYIFRFSRRYEIGGIYLSLSLVILLIVIPVSWLTRLILSGQLNHILRGEQRLDKLFSIRNVQVFLLSPSNPIRWYLKLLSFILILLLLFFLLSLLLFSLLP